MRRRVLYLDNEKNRVDKVTEIVKDTLEHVEIMQVDSLDEAYKILLERTIDIFIINIVMSGMDVSDTEGIRLVARIREIPRYILTPVIIISSLLDPQLYAYEELNCLGYLNKTFAEEKLVKLLEKASYFETQQTAEKVIVFRRNRVLYPVLIQDIVYMERENNLTLVHMADGTVLDVPYVTYSKLLYDANDSSLLLCNRGTIVNRNYVFAVDPSNCYVMLKNNMGTLDIGMKYDYDLAVQLKNYVKEARPRTDIFVTGNVVDAYKVIRRKKVALLIADIELGMKNRNENRVIRMILEFRKYAMFLFLPIIVLDSSDRYRLYAFRDWHCVGHYVKPVKREHFMELVKRILTAVVADEQENTFLVRHDNIRYPIMVKELMYVKFFNRVLHLYLKSGKVVMVNQKPVQMVLQEARAKCLIRCSRGVLVNLNFVERMDFEGKWMTLKNGTVLPIGKSYAKRLYEVWVTLDEMIKKSEEKMR